MDAFTPLDALRRSMIACAEADAATIREPQLRRYSWDPEWAPGIALAVFDNGAGDSVRVLFGSDWGLVVGFDHESSWTPWRTDPAQVLPGTFEGMPEPARVGLDEYIRRNPPSSDADPPIAATFAYWRAPGRDHWCKGPVVPPKDASPHDDGGQDRLGGILPVQIGDYLDPLHPYSAELELTVKQAFARAGLPTTQPPHRASVPIGNGRPSVVARMQAWWRTRRIRRNRAR